GLATTFFVETDFVFFDVDFPATAFFVAPTFLLEVFFEVPFFAEGLVVLRALSVCRPVFLRLAAAERLVGAFRATLPAALLPVFFLAAAFLLGITIRLQEQLHETGDYTYGGRKRKPARKGRSTGPFPAIRAGGARRRP